MPNPSLPLTFRAAEVEQIFDTIQSGDSCQVIGIGSVGKSNLMRFLLQEDLRQKHLGADWEHYLFVFINIHKLSEFSHLELFELMLHQLLVELTNWGADAELLGTIDDLHRRAIDPVTQRQTGRYLDRALALICQKLGLAVVFLLDDFDIPCRTMAPYTFANLRALRDDHKYQLMYIVSTHAPISQLRERPFEIEPFEELFSGHIVWLGTYSESDARMMLQRLMGRHHSSVDEPVIVDMLGLTGGHPGLLMAAFDVCYAQPMLKLDTPLAEHPAIQEECQQIWRNLSTGDQRALANMTETQPVPVSSLMTENLRWKGLVRQNTLGKWEIFSPLFEQYLKRFHPVSGAHIFVDRKRRLVEVDGRKIESLTPLEYECLAALEAHRGQVFSRDDLANCLYPNEMHEDHAVDNDRVDAVVKRLRKTIEPNPQKPRFILTERGVGYKLADGDEKD